MLQFIADQIDQLDLALDQLAMHDRNFDRFALMLIDNVVELTLHDHAQTQDIINRERTQLDESPQRPKNVAEALSQNFDSKVQLARATGMITESVASSILILHSFRNSVYHKGLRHEGILHSLGIFYFGCACDVLSGISPMFWTWGDRDIISHRAVKYLGSSRTISHPKEALVNACKRLREVGNSLGENLIADLHIDMAKIIKENERDINFLVENSFPPTTIKEVIINAQVWPFALTDEAKNWAINNGWEGKFGGDYVEWLQENYPWPIKGSPLTSWKRRLNSLEKEQNQHAALKKYTNFLKQTEKIRGHINELTILLDIQIHKINAEPEA